MRLSLFEWRACSCHFTFFVDTIQRRSTLKHSASNPPSYSGKRIMEAVSRAILVARDDKSFWEKYKWLVIGGAIAIPIQLVAGFF